MLDAFHIVRAEITSTSVYSHRFAESDIGIVKIVQFDLTTPTQFCEAMTKLQALGCKRFVFDVRYNLGGDLRSIEAILSYFLSEGDVLIRTKDKSGEESVSKVEEVTYSGEYAGCSVTKDDIGKYRGLDTIVLCNGSTASAAELFTATLRDYDLAKVVGGTTYGKGCMQSILPLDSYGIEGGLKLTVAMYYSMSKTVYHGTGIVPDYPVELSDEAKKINFFLLPEEKDDQLLFAINELVK